MQIIMGIKIYKNTQHNNKLRQAGKFPYAWEINMAQKAGKFINICKLVDQKYII